MHPATRTWSLAISRACKELSSRCQHQLPSCPACGDPKMAKKGLRVTNGSTRIDLRNRCQSHQSLAPFRWVQFLSQAPPFTVRTLMDRDPRTCLLSGKLTPYNPF